MLEAPELVRSHKRAPVIDDPESMQKLPRLELFAAPLHTYGLYKACVAPTDGYTHSSTNMLYAFRFTLPLEIRTYEPATPGM